MANIVHAENRKAAIKAALADLAVSRPVALPTETVYGLSANAGDGIAVARIFALKNRPQFNPLICHVASMKMAREIGAFNRLAEKLAEVFWPGPLTLVVPRRPDSGVHDLVSAGLETLAIRWPLGFAGEVIAALEKPLAAPSANKSGRVSPTIASHVAEDFIDDDLLIVDDGPATGGIESTIVRVEADHLVLLRPGIITGTMLECASGAPVLAHQETALVAPGMMASHYAPQAKLAINCVECRAGDALLAFGPQATPARKTAAHVLNLAADGSLEIAASNLYAYLKELDAQNPVRICVEPIPATGIGVAINDRLSRAAAPRPGA